MHRSVTSGRGNLSAVRAQANGIDAGIDVYFGQRVDTFVEVLAQFLAFIRGTCVRRLYEDLVDLLGNLEVRVDVIHMNRAGTVKRTPGSNPRRVGTVVDTENTSGQRW